jgi:anti-anti-sigma factor
VYDTLHVVVHPTGPGSCRVTVVGDLDVVSAPDVREAVKAAVSAHDRVEVDCGRLTFCDCTGLSALLAAARAARASGSELRLCAVPHALARLLRLTHAGSAFTIEPPDMRDRGQLRRRAAGSWAATCAATASTPGRAYRYGLPDHRQGALGVLMIAHVDLGHTVAGWTGMCIATIGFVIAGLGIILVSGFVIAAGVAVIALAVLVTQSLWLGHTARLVNT